MSDSQAYEEVTIGSDGVTLTKRFEEDEFPVPAIAFEFSSDRDEVVTVRMVDEVPDGIAVEDLGFHPEYGSEFWTIEEDRIAFERDIEANAEYTTVYGIRATGTDNVEQFLTTPTIDEVDPPLSGSETDPDDVVPEADDDVVRDVISGESDNVPGLDADDDEEIETLDLKDPNDSGSASASSRSSASSESSGSSATESDDGSADDGDVDGGESSEPDTVSAAKSAESLVAALATEIRQNNVSAEDVKLLRQAFEIAGQEGGSIQARVERLQSDVSDIRAYTDALEEFLDENGTGQQMIDEFESDLEALESDLGSFESELEGIDTTVSEVESELADNSEELSSVSDEVGSMSDDVAEVSQELADLEETVEGIQADLADVQEAVSDEDVIDRIEGIESELEDLQDWQDQIKETFGG